MKFFEKIKHMFGPLRDDEARVIDRKGTEAPYSGKYNDHFESGAYHCRKCGHQLFASDSKFHSGCGWPSFDEALPGAVRETPDPDGMRTEITCANCEGHLGHVFTGERLTDKNTRHCVNSVSLVFLPDDVLADLAASPLSQAKGDAYAAAMRGGHDAQDGHGADSAGMAFGSSADGEPSGREQGLSHTAAGTAQADTPAGVCSRPGNPGRPDHSLKQPSTDRNSPSRPETGHAQPGDAQGAMPSQAPRQESRQTSVTGANVVWPGDGNGTGAQQRGHMHMAAGTPGVWPFEQSGEQQPARPAEKTAGADARPAGSRLSREERDLPATMDDVHVPKESGLGATDRTGTLNATPANGKEARVSGEPLETPSRTGQSAQKAQAANHTGMEARAAADVDATGRPAPAPGDKKAENQPQMERAIFAGGCFWGVEHLLREQPGVLQATSGYTGGATDKPSYEQVCSGRTGHAEAVEVIFDPKRTSFENLARLFFEIHDPTQQNRQGPDVGTQYRSAIFYTDPEQKKTAEMLVQELRGHGYAVVTELAPAGTFYPAEAYHQEFFLKHPERAFCHAPVKRFDTPGPAARR